MLFDTVMSRNKPEISVMCDGHVNPFLRKVDESAPSFVKSCVIFGTIHKLPTKKGLLQVK